jgi:hypothetical protein
MDNNRITQQNCDFVRKDEHMTHGVEIDRWKDSRNKLFSLWDFAVRTKIFPIFV